MSKTKEELEQELEEVKEKREEEEELASLKADIKEEKGRITKAKYGKVLNLFNKLGEGIKKLQDESKTKKKKKKPKKEQGPDINERIKRLL